MLDEGMAGFFSVTRRKGSARQRIEIADPAGQPVGGRHGLGPKA